MTLRANPEWKGLRGVMLGLWGLALAGMALDLAPLPEAWQALARDLERASALPVPAEERGRHPLHVDMVYYSMITQCSVGYGDILPRSETARMIAVIQAVIGQFYMAVVVAVFVGMYASRRSD